MRRERERSDLAERGIEGVGWHMWCWFTVESPYRRPPQLRPLTSIFLRRTHLRCWPSQHCRRSKEVDGQVMELQCLGGHV